MRNFQKQPLLVFCKKGVLENLTNSSKNTCVGVSLVLQLCEKLTSTEAFSSEFSKIFQNTYFVKHLLTAASERLVWSKVLPYVLAVHRYGGTFLKKHVLLKYVLSLFGNVVCSLVITFVWNIVFCRKVIIVILIHTAPLQQFILRIFFKFDSKKTNRK